ncbi:MAG: hypothetical protein R3349_11685 [Geminicoccaceae bacterium]|nr:hypothetical protein [Geminicoccaceae bacterium]
MPLAIRSLILDVERVGERLIAVGERGHILISDDGRSFTQVVAPVRSTLTAVAPAGGSILAVGHDGVILESADRGTSWTLTFSAPDEERPLLDVARLGERTVLAVGAYGWLLRSEDGGATWSGRLIDGDEPHLNGIAKGDGGALLIGAEFGLTFLSRDGGRTFERHELPYRGSFFGALRLEAAWLVFGLGGRVFRKEDNEPGWRRIEIPGEPTLLAGLRLKDGRIVLGGLDGTLLVSGDGRRFELLRDPDRLGITALEELDDGSLLLAGEGGLRRMSDLDDPSTIEPVAAPHL